MTMSTTESRTIRYAPAAVTARLDEGGRLFSMDDGNDDGEDRHLSPSTSTNEVRSTREPTNVRAVGDGCGIDFASPLERAPVAVESIACRTARCRHAASLNKANDDRVLRDAGAF
jgi:hypothetical protein